MNLVRVWPALVFACLLWGGASSLAAQPGEPPINPVPSNPSPANSAEKYLSRPVAAVLFVPPDQPLPRDELSRLVAVQAGRPLAASDVRETIARLFATGRYLDIQADAQNSNRGVVIRFLTRNRWFIGSVDITGRVSSPPNAAQLENAAQLDLGQPFTEEKMNAAIAGQRRLLESNGLYRPQIRPVYEYDNAHQQMNFHFDVTSGPRARFTTPVLSGDLQMDPRRIVDATGWRRWLFHNWKKVTQARVRDGLDAVRNLYEKENRLEARISLVSLDYDPETQTALPRLNIEAGPRIQVRTIGADVSQKNLRRLVPVFQEHTVDQDLLAEGARNLRDYLESRGYFDAQVEFKQQRVTNDRASLDFLVNTGPRHRLAHIQISGNHYFTAQAIRERMLLEPASLLLFRHGRYSESLLHRDEDSITKLYQSNGFRDVKVRDRIEDGYKGVPSDLAVYIDIDEGPQYLVNSLQVDGVTQLDKAALVGRLSSVTGQPFSESNVAVDRDTILAEYFRNGYPNATFEWSSEPAAQPHRVNLRYVIAEGRHETIRDVLVSGLGVTRRKLVEETVKLAPGDPLSPTAITDAQRRLYDLGIFERVDAAIQNPDGDTPSKYVLYDLEGAGRYTMAAGAGAEIARIGGCQTCLDAPAGATGFAPRVSFDITRNNLWGLAHSLSLRTRASTLEEQALLNYTWPRFLDNDKLAVSFVGLYEDSRDVRTFSYKREEGSAQLSQKLSKATTLLYRYSYRHVSIDQATLKISPLLIPLLSQPVRVGMLSATLVDDRRDDPLDPHRGMYTTVDFGLADYVFGSQPNYFRFLARNSTYHHLSRRFILARSTEFGDISPFHYSGSAVDAIPLAERFFAGGASSNRGFPDFQAGPRDTSTGFPLGGNAVFFNQTELRFPLLGDNVGGVLFHDAGNVYSQVTNMSLRTNQHDIADFNYMVHAVGFGLRYRTPVGPVRLDLAYSINPPRFFGFSGSEQDLVNAGPNPCQDQPSRCAVTGVSHFQFFFSIGQTF
ncbi:MAG TPA: BamA/TamA family outer membrane protein [Bryobacteraceae bacterium]|nr:BamA/TamA family outer membrane protein [Bryobacteraceae bacterium]